MTIDPDALANSVARLEGVDPVDTGLDAALKRAVSETEQLSKVARQTVRGVHLPG